MTYRFSAFNGYHECKNSHDEHENDYWTYSVNLGSIAVFKGESTKAKKNDTLLTIERDGEGVVYSLCLPMGTTVSYDSRAAQPSEKLNMHVVIICERDTLRVVVSGSLNGSYDRDVLIPDYSGSRRHRTRRSEW
jgi:hypothetical protein